MIKTTCATLLTAASFLALVGSAHATLTVNTGNNPQAGQDNVIANACDAPVLGPALVIAGCLNGSHSTVVQFTSDENIQFDAGGQARVEATDADGYSFLKIEVLGHTIDTLILNIIANEDGQVQFTDGVTTSGLFNISDNGNNFFTITGGPFAFVSYTTFNTSVVETDLVGDTRQNRIGVTQVCTENCNPNITVPEPATLAVLGLGLLGLGALRRKRSA